MAGVHRTAHDTQVLTVDTTSFRALFSRSSQVEPRLRRALRRNIRQAAGGLAEDVKAEAMRPGGGVGAASGWRVELARGKKGVRAVRRRTYTYAAGRGRSTGLRANIAGRVKVAIMTGQTREGVRVTSSGQLAAAWQAQRGWRHPVFGDRGSRGPWVQQVGRPGYFYKTISAGAGDVKAAVQAAMTEAVASLGGSS